MDRLKEEYYDENEDFSEIDALLDAWSRQEVDTPENLHQKIMSVLPEEPKKAKGTKKYSRYLATAALAAIVILASISLGQMGTVDEGNDLEKMRSGEPMLFKQAVTENTIDENNNISDAASVQAASIDSFSADGAIDWKKEKEDKEALLLAQQELLEDAEDKEEIEKVIDWLKECLSAIEQEDSEKYEELLKNSPLGE